MMDCRQIKPLLPLWVGQDLPDSNSNDEISRHLQNCAACEQYRLSLQNSLEALQGISTQAQTFDSSRRSLWPQLVSRVAQWDQVQRRERFNGWIPASVMALAVALMVAVSIPSLQREFFGGGDASLADLFESNSDYGTDRGLRGAAGDSLPMFGTPVNFKNVVRPKTIDR